MCLAMKISVFDQTKEDLLHFEKVKPPQALITRIAMITITRITIRTM